jgi:hypothetical protein
MTKYKILFRNLSQGSEENHKGPQKIGIKIKINTSQKIATKAV